MLGNNNSALRRGWGALSTALLITIALAGTGVVVRGDGPVGGKPVPPEAAEFFETKIRPLLAANCFACHGADAQMSGLRLDTHAGLLKGGASGPVVIGGDPAKSPLVRVVHYDDKIKMPPAGKLKADEIAALEAWVKMGAPWPDAPVSTPAKAAAQTGEYVITAQQKRFWSFQPVRKPALPPVKNAKNAAWAVSPIDRFVLARLEAKGLKPAPPADRRTLIRRASFDLTGLPPTPEAVAAFLTDKSPNAWEKVVDRLLASPRYGERWARHWLDVARYADTKGYVFNEDRSYPSAYTYRDWVVRAFNEDLPYDQFLIQQLAADRLPLGDDKRPLAALGFLTVGRRFLNNPHDIIDDRIDVTARGLMGLTVSCARCHDHKFDPIPTKDYYALYGVFASSEESRPIISPAAIADPWRAHDKQVQDAESAERNLVTEQVKKLRARVENNETLPDPVKAALQSTRENERPSDENLAKLEPSFEAGVPATLKTLREQIATLKKSYPATPEFAMGMTDRAEPVSPHVFKRGNPGNQGDAVPRRFLQILSPGERAEWISGSGRLELARAIASPDNPLTARVMVNRIWQHHFGVGLVRTPSDFGRQGEPPTHPELLDWLAATFVADGWSIKKLHRRILLSNTYRQSSDFNPRAFQADPENRLVWRMNRQRLELEALRDSLLWASGRLDTTLGGPSVELWQAPYPARRTIYGRIDRQNLPGTFRAFDFASPDTSSAQRFQTTVPQQALFLLNSPFVAEQARSLVRRPEIARRPDDAARVRAVYRLLFSRAPGADELALGLKFLQSNGDSALAVEAPVWRYGYGRYDAAARRVAGFTPLARWTGDGWQGGDVFPDATLRFLRLTATGGHPGSDAAHAAVRRWVAPSDGVVSIRGTIGHGHVGDGGDGVEAFVVSSRSGLLGTWIAQRGKAETIVEKADVRKGDTIDFVVSCRASDSFDSFTWAPLITAVGAKTVWNANAQFGGPVNNTPPLGAWERYAQALLMTNEFTFVD